MLLRDGKLRLNFHGTAAKLFATSELSLVCCTKALLMLAGIARKWWQVAELSDRSEGKRPQISRAAISASRCLNGECPRRKSIVGSPPCRRKLARCVQQRRSSMTFCPASRGGRAFFYSR
ncbi:hypothetical protein ACFIOY_18295 [Bradyrhizobium sp. TZ2]